MLQSQANTRSQHPLGQYKMAYSIGDRINNVAPHHESIKALWETKWKKPVRCRALQRGGQ